jgi:hypothetical protein
MLRTYAGRQSLSTPETGPLAVVIRGVEHSTSRVRTSSIAASLRFAQVGMLTSQQVAAIIAARLEDVSGAVRRASVAALGHL